MAPRPVGSPRYRPRKRPRIPGRRRVPLGGVRGERCDAALVLRASAGRAPSGTRPAGRHRPAQAGSRGNRAATRRPRAVLPAHRAPAGRRRPRRTGIRAGHRPERHPRRSGGRPAMPSRGPGPPRLAALPRPPSRAARHARRVRRCLGVLGQRPHRTTHRPGESGADGLRYEAAGSRSVNGHAGQLHERSQVGVDLAGCRDVHLGRQRFHGHLGVVERVEGFQRPDGTPSLQRDDPERHVRSGHDLLQVTELCG